MEGWVSTELRSVDFNDKRLNDRFIRLTEQLSSKPTATIPSACGKWANTKAAYRFFDSAKVRPEIIRRAHIESTIERVIQHDCILAVQDTTNIDFSSHPATNGLGFLDNIFARGFKMHSCLAITTEGIPLGLLHQDMWVRDYNHIGKKYLRDKLPTKNKESQRWITTVKKIENIIPDKVRVVVIGDRESDIYDLFAAPRRKGIDLLVRGNHNRKVNHERKYLFPVIQKSPVKGEITIQLRRGDKRPQRRAKLSVKYQKIEITPSDHHRNRASLKPVSLYAVGVDEIKPPAGQKGVSWLLLTTVDVNSLDDAVKVIEWYTRRWVIERYHYTLKSGCRVEDLELETVERLENAVATYCIVAWRVLWMTYEARENPDSSCIVILDTFEWKALCCFINKKREPPPNPPTVRDAVRSIAKLGGFLGRKGDKEPGVKTIWQGLRRLDDISAMWLAMGGDKRSG